MARFFNFYDPLEKRYVFNSFLVVVGLVEVLILICTLVWQIDEGVFTQHPVAVPFPWKEYLLAGFTAPIALLFLFGLIIQGFEIFGREASGGQESPRKKGGKLRRRYLLGLGAVIVLLVALWWGNAGFSRFAAGVKALGLGGSYLLIALLALGLLYLPLRLFLRYRLQKKAMEYQYLLTLARRHGVVLVDPKLHPELAASLEGEKNSDSSPLTLLASPPDPDRQ